MMPTIGRSVRARTASMFFRPAMRNPAAPPACAAAAIAAMTLESSSAEPSAA